MLLYLKLHMLWNKHLLIVHNTLVKDSETIQALRISIDPYGISKNTF